MKLKKYLELRRITPSAFATEIGRNRQSVEQWRDKGATIIDDHTGITIALENIVHEPQVKK